MDNVEQINKLLEEGLNLGETTKATVKDNLFYLDMRPIAEYERLIEDAIPMHQIVDLYEKWSIQVLKTVKENADNFHNAKLVETIVKMRFMLLTIQQFFPSKNSQS